MTYPKEIYEFLRVHGDSINMFVVAMDDYVACRACFFANCPFQAAVLGAQCVEKLFKGGLRLSGDQRRFKQMGHRLAELQSEVVRYSWFDANIFGELIGSLEYHFNHSRYPKTSDDADRMACRRGIDLQLLQPLDRLIFDFINAIPVDARVRYSLGLYAEWFNKQLLESGRVPSVRWNTIALYNGVISRSAQSIVDAVQQNGEFLTGHPLPGIMSLGEPVQETNTLVPTRTG